MGRGAGYRGDKRVAVRVTEEKGVAVQTRRREGEGLQTEKKIRQKGEG